MTLAAKKEGQIFWPQKTFSPKESERELGSRFSQIISIYTVKQLSGASDATIDAAKKWPRGHVPNLGNTLRMGRTLKAVRDFVLAEMGCEIPTPDAPPNARMMQACYALLQQWAMEPGEKGAMARDVLHAALSEASKT